MPFNPRSSLPGHRTLLSLPLHHDVLREPRRLGIRLGEGKETEDCQWAQSPLTSNHSSRRWTIRHQGHLMAGFVAGSQTNSATYGYWIHRHNPSALMGSFPRNSLYLLLFFLSLSKHAFPKTSGSSTFGASSLFLPSSALFYVTVCPTSMLT